MIGSSGCDGDRAVVVARLKNLQSTGKLSVRYDPDDPKMSIVYVGTFDWLDYFLPAVAITLLVSGLALLKKGWKSLQHNFAVKSMCSNCV